MGREAHAVVFEPELVDLGSVVEEAVQACPARERIVLTPAEGVMVVVDPRRITVACKALLQAALDAGGRAAVEVRGGRTATVEIAVSGGEVANDGIALSLARWIASSHGGDAGAWSLEGNTRLILVLPAAPRPQEKRAGTILLIDDNVEHAHALAALLRHEGFTIDVSNTAHDALDRVAKHPPDLLLLDLQLPEISGDRVLQLARERCPGLPAIVITGYPRDHETVQAILAEPGIEYVAKPADLDVLFAIASKMLRRSRDRA